MLTGVRDHRRGREGRKGTGRDPPVRGCDRPSGRVHDRLTASPVDPSLTLTIWTSRARSRTSPESLTSVRNRSHTAVGVLPSFTVTSEAIHRKHGYLNTRRHSAVRWAWNNGSARTRGPLPASRAGDTPPVGRCGGT